LRAARVILAGRNRILRTAKVALSTINNIERGAVDPKKSLGQIVRAFTDAGIKFIPEGGPRSVAARECD
jgi:hypothetical protein